MTTRPTCHECGEGGPAVGSVTLEHLVRPPRLETLGAREGFHYCQSAGCEVVYYHPDGRTVRLGDLLETPFEKSEDPARKVCFCFEHRVRAVEAEVERTGDSAVPAEIAEKCRQGLDRCEETNPAGHCCLGAVRRVVAEARARAGAVEDGASEEEAACCAPRSGAEHDACG